MLGKTYYTPGGFSDNLFNDALSQPHLLVAGECGSGKSVFENGLIYTLLYRAPIDISNGVQLILIDPKRVELARYKKLPHTLKYASEPSEMVMALQYTMDLIERRYKTMQRKNLLKYDGGDIYVFIDEFADLMTTQGKTIKPLIQRIAQIGRAALVHIVLLTQCPLAKVIPTEIKVNFDARVGLRTGSAQDSRNIIGETGCETLPKFGKCYYKTPDNFFIHKVRFYSQEEIQERIDWWLKQTSRKSLFGKLFG